MLAATPSSWRPPWFDTMMPSTPAATARLASSAVITPLATMGPRHCSRIHSQSLHVGGEVVLDPMASPMDQGGHTGLPTAFGTPLGTPPWRRATTVQGHGTGTESRV